jgi:hypothetical protein
MTLRSTLLLAAALWVGGCSANLPEPESEGARLYADRCTGGCHRAYAPGSMKYEMWKVQLERMQGEMVRRGLPPLTEKERTIVLDYLKRHSA